MDSPMNLLVNVAAAYLATRRVTTLMTSDTITEPMREWVWKRQGPEDTKIGYLFTCRKCSSVWAGAVVLAAIMTRPGRALAGVLALSEASILTDALLPPEIDL